MFKKNIYKKTILLGLFVVVGLNSNIASAQIVNLRPAQVLQFKWISGKPLWINANFSRLTRSVWQFDTSRGSVVMYQPDGYPPLRGTYRVNGNVITLRGYFASSTGFTGNSTAEFYGQLDFSRGRPVLNMAYVSGNTLAAVINGIKFGNSKGKAYQATLVLR